MNVIELIDKCRENGVGIMMTPHVESGNVEITLFKCPFETSKTITSQELNIAKFPDKYVEFVVDGLLGDFEMHINKVKEEISGDN